MDGLEQKTLHALQQSHNKVIEDLHTWHKNIVSQLDQMYDNILLDMKNTYEDVQYFASFTSKLLLEQENLLEKATSNGEIDIIQERINEILTEIKFLQSLSFHLNCDSVKLHGKLQLNFNKIQIKSNHSLMAALPYFYNASQTIIHSSKRPTWNKQSILLSTTYRFLISRIDAIQLNKTSLPIFHLTSSDNQSIHDCVLTFNVFNLVSFLNAFTAYWNLFPKNNEIRMLIPQYNVSYLTNKLNETSRSLIDRFKLDQINFFPCSCPKSDERILLISGTRRDYIKDCIQEIYFNIEKYNENEDIKQDINLYNPTNLTNDDINEIILSNMDYGGFIRNRNKAVNENQSKIEATEDEKSNDDWWNFRNTRDSSSEIIQREMIVSNKHAGAIIGVNASHIDRIKQKTGAYVYIDDQVNGLKRTAIMKGTREQVDRAYLFIENLIERNINDKNYRRNKDMHI
ncbi:unnamed protein product [Rotaria magnacalcarata]|uniref:K Homology domain-containing protein n=3 Tax=Rotaria magnacalcarata TaxID=392030 RepID=A0A816C8J5_9BILA|nr:unnamed protein product [Rotaria magnacalcarata]